MGGSPNPRPESCVLKDVPPNGPLVDSETLLGNLQKTADRIKSAGITTDADRLWTELENTLKNTPVIIPEDK